VKNLILAFVSSAGLIALAGCADESGSHTAYQSGSATLSSDPKDMTSRTATSTSTDITPPSQTEKSTTTQTETDDNGPSYPAIHSNGQGAGI